MTVIKDVTEPITSLEIYRRTNNDFISRWVVLRGKKVPIGCGFYGKKMVHIESCECDDEYERSVACQLNT